MERFIFIQKIVIIRIELLACGGFEVIELTEKAALKAREIIAKCDPLPKGLRVGVQGGGCSGLSYALHFVYDPNEIQVVKDRGDECSVPRDDDTIYEFGGLKVFVDPMSEMYLEGVTVDYVETLERAGFQFKNPNVKSQCGCGSSFQA